MSAYGGDDVQEKLYNLEQEELRIMRELMELDDAAESNAPRTTASPRAALNALIAECERDVRAAKGFIRPGVTPIQIVRVVPGTGKVPKSATYLSRPKGTGVDFTVPVTLPEYLQAIKSPIFLNDIRDKCSAAKYDSSEDYLEDMRLLARNTATFNRGEDLSWVVQHARLLLEAAEEAVTARREKFFAAESALRKAESQTAGHGTANAPGKRRRSSGVSSKSGAAAGATSAAASRGNSYAGGGTHASDRGSGIPPPPPTAAPMPSSSSSVTAGARLFVFWQEDRSWYSARVVKKMSVHRAEVEYDDDGSRQIVDLRVDHWRPIDTAASSGRARKASATADAPPSKRQKSANVGSGAGAGAAPAAVSHGVSRSELMEIVETWTTNLEQMRTTLMNEIHSRFDRIERTVHRADAMRRVLLAVNDLADVVADESGQMRTQIASIEARLEESIAIREAAEKEKVQEKKNFEMENAQPGESAAVAHSAVQRGSRRDLARDGSGHDAGDSRPAIDRRDEAGGNDSDASGVDEAKKSSREARDMDQDEDGKGRASHAPGDGKDRAVAEEEGANMEIASKEPRDDHSRTGSLNEGKGRAHRDGDGRPTDGAAESTVLDTNDGIGDSMVDGPDEGGFAGEEGHAGDVSQGPESVAKRRKPDSESSAGALGSEAVDGGKPTSQSRRDSNFETDARHAHVSPEKNETAGEVERASDDDPKEVYSMEKAGKRGTASEDNDRHRVGSGCPGNEDAEKAVEDGVLVTVKETEVENADDNHKERHGAGTPECKRDGSQRKHDESSESSSSDGDSSSSSDGEDGQTKRSGAGESEADSSDRNSASDHSEPPTRAVDSSEERSAHEARASGSQTKEAGVASTHHGEVESDVRELDDVEMVNRAS